MLYIMIYINMVEKSMSTACRAQALAPLEFNILLEHICEAIKLSKAIIYCI